nr:ArsR family transcriptional regulator [Halobaculum sp. DT31]
MRLVRPTDFDILEAFSEHGRNVAPNIAEHLERDKGYINTRLPQLTDYGLLARIGPSENSGLYEITNRGRAALELRDEYEDADDFEAVIDTYLDGE